MHYKSNKYPKLLDTIFLLIQEFYTLYFDNFFRLHTEVCSNASHMAEFNYSYELYGEFVVEVLTVLVKNVFSNSHF